jgi:hypothetical protein
MCFGCCLATLNQFLWGGIWKSVKETKLMTRLSLIDNQCTMGHFTLELEGSLTHDIQIMWLMKRLERVQSSFLY